MSDNNGDSGKPAVEEVKLNISLSDIQRTTQSLASDNTPKSTREMMLDSPYGIYMSDSQTKSPFSQQNQIPQQQMRYQQQPIQYQQQPMQYQQQQPIIPPQQYYQQQYNVTGGYQPQMQSQSPMRVQQAPPVQMQQLQPAAIQQTQNMAPIPQGIPQGIPDQNMQGHHGHHGHNGHNKEESLGYHQFQPGQRFVPHYVPEHPHYNGNYAYTHYHPHPPPHAHPQPQMYQQQYGGGQFNGPSYQQQMQTLEMGSAKERQSALVKILDKDTAMLGMDDRKALGKWGSISGASTFGALCAILFPFAIVSMKNIEREAKIKYLKVGMGVQFVIGFSFLYSSYKVTQVLEDIDKKYFRSYTLSELNNYLMARFNGNVHSPQPVGQALAGMNRSHFGAPPAYYQQQMQSPQYYGNYQNQPQESVQNNSAGMTDQQSKLE